jgi:hypothetical protein
MWHPRDPAIMNICAVGLALAGFDEQPGTAFVHANIRRCTQIPACQGAVSIAPNRLICTRVRAFQRQAADCAVPHDERSSQMII